MVRRKRPARRTILIVTDFKELERVDIVVIPTFCSLRLILFFTQPAFIFSGKVMRHHPPDEDDQQGGDDEHGDGAPPHEHLLERREITTS